MSRTVLPLEDTRASTISELKDLKPQNDHVVTLEGESSPADGKSNFFWWDPSGDPQNADGVTKVESNVENSGLWRRIVAPSPDSTDDLPEGSNSLFHTTSRVRNALSAGGDLSYDQSTGEFSVSTSGLSSTDDLPEGSTNLYYTSDRVRNEFEATGDLTYVKNPVSGYDLSSASYTGTSFDVSSEDGIPSGVSFGDGGSKMFVVGLDNQNIFEYSLGTAFDVSTATYTGTSLDVGGDDGSPRGITFNGDGTKMFMAGASDNNIYEYNFSTGFDLSTASYSGTNFGIGSEEGDVRGIVFNTGGTKMFITGSSSATGSSAAVHEYDLSTGFDISTASYSGNAFSASSEESTPLAIAFNTGGTKMFITGSGSNEVYEYDLGTGFDLSTASYSGTSFDVSSEESGYPTAITFSGDGTKMFTIGTSSDQVHEYNTSATGGKARFGIDVSEVPDLLSSSTTDDLSEGLTNLYFTEQRAKDAVNFATGENIELKDYSGQIKFESEYDLGSGQNDWQDAEALAFNGDGTKVFFTGDNESTSDCIVVEYDLGTAYDIQTLSYTGNNFPNTYGNVTGIDFNGDGTKMFVSDESSNQIIEYSLGSGYDLSSNVSENNTYDKSSEGGAGPDGLELGDGGNKLFVIDNGDVYEYSLGTAYDLSTISYTTSFGLEDNENRAISFNGDGSVMYATLGTSFSSALKYELSTPFDISSASYTGTEFSNLKYDNGRGMVVVGSKLFGVDNERIGQYNIDPNPEFTLVNISGVDDSTTDDLDEGSNNLYYTDGRVDDRVRNGLTTDDLSEGSNNLYYTSDRVKNEFEAGDGLSYNKEPVTGGFDMSKGSFSNISFDTFNEEADPHGLAFNGDGTKMFVIGQDSDSVHEYDLSTGYDLITASYTGTSFDTSSETVRPTGLAFNTGGTKMFVSDAPSGGSSFIYEYSLSSSFDISTASIDTNFDTTNTNGDEVYDPQDVVFNGDGTKMFVPDGGVTESIHSYDLSTAFDVDTVSWNNDFDTTSESLDREDLTFNSDGTKLYLLSGGNNRVYEYNLGTAYDLSTISYTGKSLDISSEDTYSKAIHFNGDGTKLFVAGGDTSEIYQYGVGETSDVSQFSVDVTGVGDSTTDDLNEGSNNLYFTEERVDDRVDGLITPGLHLSSTYNDSSDSLVLDADDDLSNYSNDAGFITDLTTFTTDDLSEGPNNLYYTSDRVKGEFGSGGDLNYTKEKTVGFALSNGTYTGTSFDVSGEDGSPYAVEFNNDGTKMFVVGGSNDSVYEYSLGTAYDLSSASYSGTSFDVSSEDGSATALTFNTGGTKMFVLGNGNDSVYEYNLSSGFDISTASYSGTSFDVSSEASFSEGGIVFNGDGTKMLFLGTTSSYDYIVYEYNLGTGFDLSTASYSGTSFDVSSTSGDSLAFSEDGTKMFIVGDGDGNDVYEYDLGTGFDLSTASYSGTSFDVESEVSAGSGLGFSGDGTKMFVLGSFNATIFEYEIGETKAEFSVDVPEISVGDSGSGVLSDLNSLDFGKALTATDDGSGSATVDLDAGFSSATFSGDGTKTQFQIPHGLSSQPSSWIVQSATGDGSDISHVTADGTSLTVNYDSAPPSGTDNVELNWIAIQ